VIIAESTHTVVNRHNDAMYCTLTPAHGDAPRVPLLLILHGFKGFRNYSFLPWIAQSASQMGIMSVRMDFSLNGMKGTSWMVQDTDAFARNTISREVDDAHDMLTALTTDIAFAHVQDRWDGRLFVIGHSRGGGIAQILTRELIEAEPSRPIRTVVLNSVGTWMRWTPRQRDLWSREGGMTFTNERTGQQLRMDMSYIDDLEQHAERLSLIDAARNCGENLHFVHAEADLTVPLSEIVALREASQCAAQLSVLTNTTHTFGMTHPIDRITPGLVDMISTLRSWLLR
jgi:pimeloyl-ACP methyl ester carboxylesterase